MKQSKYPVKGFALPVALIVLSLLTALSMGLGYMAKDQMASIQQRKILWGTEKASLNALNEVGYLLLVGDHKEDSVTFREQSLKVNSTPFQYGDLQLEVQDAAGLMGLAFYNQRRFQRLLEEISTREEALKISMELKDWIDSDSNRSYKGGEAINYQAKGYLQSPRNEPLRSLGELLELPSFSPELLNGVEDGYGISDVVLAGGESHFNVAAAPDWILKPVLSLSEEQTARLSELRRRQDWEGVLGLLNPYDPIFDGSDPFMHSNSYVITAFGVEGHTIKAHIRLKPYQDDALFQLVYWNAPHFSYQ